jgi:Family of unknown function (DUF6502)
MRQARTNTGRGARRSRDRSSALDARAREAVTRFVRVLARTGCSPVEIARQVERAGREVPRSWLRNTRAQVRAMDAAAHALTIWYSDPSYVDARGKPRVLPIHGSGPSLEALARRADPALGPSEILPHLLRPKALRRLRRGFLPPSDRVLWFRGSGDPYHSRSVQGLLAMLRTLEHNGRSARTTPGWFEAFAVNPRFPVSARPAFDERIRRMGMRLLSHVDVDMHRRERRRKKGERTVPLGVGIYLFEETPLRRAAPRRRRRRSKQR